MSNILQGKRVLIASLMFLLQPFVVEAAVPKQAIKSAMPSLVEVHVFNEEGKPVSSGSGVIVGRGGLIVTNYHVIKGAKRARVTLNNGETVRVVGVREVDAERDFAIIQVEAGNLPAARLGDSSKLESGDEVIAIGSPLGLTKTVTIGIVSRIWLEDHRMIQHTAAISPGNSGGPLLNVQGEVVGLNTFLIEKGHSLFFALPINYVKQALRNLPKELVSLSEVATAQLALDEKNRTKAAESFVQENFIRYEDPDGLFSIMLPKAWRVQRSLNRESDGSVTVLFMASSPSAEQAKLNGWMSAGIRIRFVVPPKDRRWTGDSRKDWARRFLASSLEGYIKVLPSDPIDCQWGGLKGIEVILGGTAAKLSQPELASLAVIPGEEVLIAVEMALPAEEKDLFQILHQLFNESFSLGS